ncbi:MAG: formate dehydrogenase accessory sulfurtransferase FdhD, partial [Sphingomonadaceae bacterium]|nr:formate dehydrogenase accessory sulfurtransferase FdhD [Sphingomonadaceae bacterium]
MAREEPPIRWLGGVSGASDRVLADEVPVAIVVNGTTLAVLLATPVDLEDFAIGFVLTEALASAAAEAGAVEIVRHAEGIEARLSLPDTPALTARRRAITGPSGCGLCGIESLAEAVRPPRAVTAPGPRPTPAEIVAAMAALAAAQPL